MKGLIKNCKAFFTPRLTQYEETVRIFCLNEVAVNVLVALTAVAPCIICCLCIRCFQLFLLHHVRLCVCVHCDGGKGQTSR